MDGTGSTHHDRERPTGGPGGRLAPSTDRFAELLWQARHGDEVAFAELYDASAPRVYGLVRRIVGDPTRAEEVTCEVFLEIWRTAAHFDETRSTAVAWMVSIAHRSAVERLRTGEGARRAEPGHPAVTSRSGGAGTLPAPSSAASATSAAHRMGEALETLSIDRRGALELAYFDGCTHAEVGSLLGLPRGAATATLRDGLTDLRRTMDNRP